MAGKIKNKHIIHVCSIKEHPIMELPARLREVYVDGLSSLLAEMSRGNAYLKTICTVWCESIVGHPYNSFQENPDNVKRALSLQRIKFHWFRMSYPLLFDCYYLVETWDFDKIGTLKQFLQEKYCKHRLKKPHIVINSFFTQNTTNPKIPTALIENRKQNLRFEYSKMKRVLVVANISSGKSTLINAIVGQNVCKSANRACTDRLRYIYNKRCEDGYTFAESSDKNIQYQRDYSRELSANDYLSFHFNSTLSNQNICLIDTPGANNCESLNHGEITINAIKGNKYDLLLFISNCKYNGTTDDKRLLEVIAKQCSKPTIFALNQLDAFKSSEDSFSRMISDYRNDLVKIGIKNPVIAPVSALAGCLLKASENQLDEEDIEDRNTYQEKFSKFFYDLPFYTTNSHTRTPLEATGIINIENTIQNIK